MYCQHGRCKTRAYRKRQKEAALSQAMLATQPAMPAALSPAKQVVAGPAAAAPAPQRFSHAVACSCGRQVTIQILVSHDQAEDGHERTSIEPVESFVSVTPSVDESVRRVDGKTPPTGVAAPPLTSDAAIKSAPPVPPLKSDTGSSTKSSASGPLTQDTKVQAEVTGVDSSRPSMAPAQPASEAFNRALWQLAQTDREAALDIFQRQLEAGRLQSDLVTIERAYCGIAVVHALHRDRLHATDMLRQAQGTAMSRADTAWVEKIARLVDKLLAPGAVHSNTE